MPFLPSPSEGAPRLCILREPDPVSMPPTYLSASTATDGSRAGAAPFIRAVSPPAGDFDKTGLSSTEAHANYRAGFNDDATPLVAGEANLQPSALACSQSCQNNSKCTVYVYCPKPAGCDNGYGKKYPYQVMLRRVEPKKKER